MDVSFQTITAVDCNRSSPVDLGGVSVEGSGINYIE